MSSDQQQPWGREGLGDREERGWEGGGERENLPNKPRTLKKGDQELEISSPNPRT